MRRYPTWALIAGALVLAVATGGCAPPEERLGRTSQQLSAADTPIIITHGLAGWPFDPALKPHLESLGYSVYMPKVAPFGSVELRAEELRTKIDDYLDSVGAARGIIVAHSMGGVDARWLLSPDGLGYDRIEALVTIASPHRGTAIADAVIEGVPWFLQRRVDRFLKLLDLTQEEAGTLEALHDLSTGGMEQFNAEVHDSPDVQYYSYSSQQKPIEGLNPLLYVSYYIIKSADGANDGIATVDGAKWGHYLGNLEADHADHVGGLAIPTQFDFEGLYVDAIESAFQHHNQGTYDPAYSMPAEQAPLPESEHEYWNNSSTEQTYQQPGASELVLTFDTRTDIEEGYDFLHVSTGDGTPVAGSPFTGDALSGATLTVPDDTVRLRLETDYIVTRWGYAIEEVQSL